MTTSAHETATEQDPRRWATLVVCLLAGFLVLLDGSMINVALPSIERSLELTSIEVTWTLSGYILAFGLTLVTAGRLGDDYGRRRMFLIHSAGALCLCQRSIRGCGPPPRHPAPSAARRDGCGPTARPGGRGAARTGRRRGPASGDPGRGGGNQRPPGGFSPSASRSSACSSSGSSGSSSRTSTRW
jgi:uncharacterized membrane protein YgcG